MLQITEKCLPPILQLQHLEELVLEECHGIDDEGLEALKRNCKRNSLKVHSFVVFGILLIWPFSLMGQHFSAVPT